MTPMKKGDKPARLSTGPMSLWGYCWHIDAKSNRQNGLKWDAPPTSNYPHMCPTIPIKSEKEVDFDVLRKMITELKRFCQERRGGDCFCHSRSIVCSSFERVGSSIVHKSISCAR